MAKIYFADDDPDTRTLVVACLERAGHEVEGFANGASLLSAFRRSPSDLAILDVMMPGMSGLETLSELRRASSLPVLLLTAKGDPDDQCEGLDLGADDYLPKPFELRVLVSRVQALLRRTASPGPQATISAKLDHDLVCKNLAFEAKTRRFWVTSLPRKTSTAATGRPNPSKPRRQELKLTPLEADLLGYLMARFEEPVARGELVRAVWGYEEVVASRAPDEANRRLRRKLLDAGSQVINETVWGYGWRLAPKEVPQDAQ